MCSVDADEVILMVNKQNIKPSDICRKCNATGCSVILRETDVYCNSCFVSYFVHKFRSTIGKSKQIKHKDKVLIGFSGGKNSSVILNLIRQGLDELSHKKLRFDPAFIFVNEQGINQSCPSTDICLQVTKLNFPCYHIQFEEVFSPNRLDIAIYNENENQKIPEDKRKCSYVEECQSFLGKIKNTSAYEDLIIQMRNELICRSAKELGFKKIFLCENGTNLSIRILSDIALGRGSQLSGHVHFKSSHFDIDVLRPLRELLEIEIDYYVNISNLCIPIVENLPRNCSNNNSSIISCTKNFVFGLQREFPATISTIFKTGDKLVANNFDTNESIISSPIRSYISEVSDETTYSHLSSEANSNLPEHDSTCIFCGFVQDTDQGSSSALEAVTISKLMSSLKPPTKIFSKINPDKLQNLLCLSENLVKDGDLEEFGTDKFMEDEARKYLCYGCINMLSELDSMECLPARVLKDYKIIKQKESLKDIIDFLL